MRRISKYLVTITGKATKSRCFVEGFLQFPTPHELTQAITDEIIKLEAKIVEVTEQGNEYEDEAYLDNLHQQITDLVYLKDVALAAEISDTTAEGVYELARKFDVVVAGVEIGSVTVEHHHIYSRS